jgi:hypothetical protein
VKRPTTTLSARVIAWLNETSAPGLSIRVGDVLRYAEFVDEIFSRFQTAAADHSHHLSNVFERKVFRPRLDHRKHMRVQLEIETFYLFSKILLDKLSNLIERYFGSARSLSLASHDRLVKHINGYLELKHLQSLSERHVDLVREMRERVSDFRDYHNAHDQSNRPRSLSWSRDDPTTTRIGFGTFTIGSRTSSADVVETESLDVLYRHLFEYLDLWFIYLSEHAAACQLGHPARASSSGRTTPGGSS